MKKNENSKIVSKMGNENAAIYIADGMVGGTSPGASKVNNQMRSSNRVNVDDIKELPTIEELENIKVEEVCGTDERSQILNTNIYPWSAICQLIITRADGLQARATGWLNGKGTVITAGHCVHSVELNQWNKSITVIPSRNGTEKPNGEIISENLWSVNGWVSRHDENYDYGAIILNNHIGDTTGYFGFASYTDSDLSDAKVNLSGYPGDKPNTQWAMYDKVKSINPKKVYYMIDTIPGHSGSPVWNDAPNGQHYAVGIHAYGGCPNSATRINDEVYNNLLTWRELGNR